MQRSIEKDYYNKWSHKNKDKLQIKWAKFSKTEKYKIWRKQYNLTHRKEKRDYERRLRASPEHKLRTSVTRQITSMLFTQKSNKNKRSFSNFVDWDLKSLRSHIESLFEDWMNWDNYGRYVPERWNDTDSSTWRWQLDHIIPQSNLPYASMRDANFKKCWSISNLRPYSAKQNILDGVSRTRHKQK